MACSLLPGAPSPPLPGPSCETRKPKNAWWPWSTLHSPSWCACAAWAVLRRSGPFRTFGMDSTSSTGRRRATGLDQLLLFGRGSTGAVQSYDRSQIEVASNCQGQRLVPMKIFLSGGCCSLFTLTRCRDDTAGSRSVQLIEPWSPAQDLSRQSYWTYLRNEVTLCCFRNPAKIMQNIQNVGIFPPLKRRVCASFCCIVALRGKEPIARASICSWLDRTEVLHVSCKLHPDFSFSKLPEDRYMYRHHAVKLLVGKTRNPCVCFTFSPDSLYTSLHVAGGRIQAKSVTLQHFGLQYMSSSIRDTAQTKSYSRQWIVSLMHMLNFFQAGREIRLVQSVCVKSLRRSPALFASSFIPPM